MWQRVKDNFKTQFNQLWTEGWREKWFYLDNKVVGEYLVDHEYLVADDSLSRGVKYRIASNNAWDRLLEVYADEVALLEPEKRYLDTCYKVKQEHIEAIKLYLDREYGHDIADVELDKDFYSVRIDGDYYVFEDDYSVYDKEITIENPEDLAAFVKHYHFCNNVQHELNQYYKAFLTDLKNELAKLGKNYNEKERKD